MRKKKDVWRWAICRDLSHRMLSKPSVKALGSWPPKPGEQFVPLSLLCRLCGKQLLLKVQSTWQCSDLGRSDTACRVLSSPFLSCQPRSPLVSWSLFSLRIYYHTSSPRQAPLWAFLSSRSSWPAASPVSQAAQPSLLSSFSSSPTVAVLLGSALFSRGAVFSWCVTVSWGLCCCNYHS